MINYRCTSCIWGQRGSDIPWTPRTRTIVRCTKWTSYSSRSGWLNIMNHLYFAVLSTDFQDFHCLVTIGSTDHWSFHSFAGSQNHIRHYQNHLPHSPPLPPHHGPRYILHMPLAGHSLSGLILVPAILSLKQNHRRFNAIALALAVVNDLWGEGKSEMNLFFPRRGLSKNLFHGGCFEIFFLLKPNQTCAWIIFLKAKV